MPSKNFSQAVIGNFIKAAVPEDIALPDNVAQPDPIVNSGT